MADDSRVSGECANGDDGHTDVNTTVNKSISDAGDAVTSTNDVPTPVLSNDIASETEPTSNENAVTTVTKVKHNIVNLFLFVFFFKFDEQKVKRASLSVHHCCDAWSN